MMARTSIFLALLDGVVRLCFMPWYYTNIVKLDFYSATFAHEILKIPSSLNLDPFKSCDLISYHKTVVGTY
jgi:hypothetical protein